MTFRHSKRWYYFANIIACVLGVVFSFAPALIATICNFPIMVTNNNESTISMLFVVALILAATGLLYLVAKTMKKNPFLVIIVSLAFLTAILISVYKMEAETIKGLCWVAGSATGGCALAAMCFALHKHWNGLYKNCGEIYGEISTK